MKALQQSAHLIGAILLMTAQQAWANPEGSISETPIKRFATSNLHPGQGFLTTMPLVLLPSSPLDYTPTPKDAQQPHEPQSIEMDIPGRVLPSNFQRVYATRPDALLASHFLSWDPSQPDGPVTSRNPQTFRFTAPVNSRNGDAVTTAPVPFVQETSMTLLPRGPEVDLLLCTIPTSASNLRPFNSASCPIFDGGQRAGAKILPLSMDHLASMVDLQRQMKTGGILPSGALDIIRTFLREQKDVRPALLLLDQIICGKVPATPDDVYQAAWLLARAFHAEADRLSALLVYNALIERAPSHKTVAWPGWSVPACSSNWWWMIGSQNPPTGEWV